MANEMPDPSNYSGLCRKVLEYNEAFRQLTHRFKQPDFSDADWAPIEAMVDVENWDRLGVFLGEYAETIDWPGYRARISQYAGRDTGGSIWEGTLRGITQTGNRVWQELIERNISPERTHLCNSVTVWDFNDEGKLNHLEVFVMPISETYAEKR